MTEAEYTAVAESLRSARPMSILIFGVGRDANLWYDLRPKGSLILWVEDDPKWAAACPGPVLFTQYQSTVAGWDADPLGKMNAWPCLRRMEFEWILIDGPRGDSPDKPGRLCPIAFASYYPLATVIVHDVHRPAERRLCEKYLKDRPFREVHHLRLYGAS